MGEITKTFKPGDYVKASCLIETDVKGICLIKGLKYKVLAWVPREPIGEFKSEKDKYEFFCGQIIPERFNRGTLYLDWQGVSITVDDNYFIYQ